MTRSSPQGPAVRALVHVAVALLDDPADTTLRSVGSRLETREYIVRLAARTTTSHDVMKQVAALSASLQAADLDDQTRHRGVRVRSVLPPDLVAQMPLATTIYPGLRVAPVPLNVMVCDAREVLLADPRGGADVAGWVSTDPPFVTLATDAFREVWDGAVPWEETAALPPLSARRHLVALGLAEGLTDREIAQTLGVSERTVSAEVSAVVEWVGARNRGHAVAKIVGAG